MLPFNQSVTQIVTDLNLSSLAPEEREQALEQIEEMFFNIVRDLMIARMDNAQYERYKAALEAEDPQKFEEEVASITSEIPGFAEDLETRLTQEYERLKKIMSA